MLETMDELEMFNIVTVLKKSSHFYLRLYCTGFYCSSLQCNYKFKTYSKVKVAFNNIFYIFMGHGQISVSQTMIAANIDPFNVVMRKYMPLVCFSKQIDECDNIIDKTLFKSFGFQNSKFFNMIF